MDLSDPSISQTLQSIQHSGFDFYSGIEIVILIFLLASSALISGSEAAFFSLTPTDKEKIQDDSKNRYEGLQKLLDRPQELLATILVANNFVNVAIVILSSALLQDILPEDGISESFRLFIEVVAITFVLLLIGEVIPKIYATKNALHFSNLMSKPLDVIRRTPPLSWIKSFLVNGSTIIHRKARKRGVKISTDELEKALALTKEAHTTDEEHKLLEGIVKFGATEVTQIMRSRMDVIAIDKGDSYQNLLQIILKSGYSRIPVYTDSFDHVIGILCVKDLLPYISEENFNWTSKLRKPLFVPENKKIDDLLKEFQFKKVHMAVVVDEYGGASGVCTLEDILEEIVGDITDEFDDDEIVYTQVDEGIYLFEGRTALVDVVKVLNFDSKIFDETKGDADTIGGYVVENAGRILMNNEFIEVGNLKMVVESSDKKRIKMVKICVNNA